MKTLAIETSCDDTSLAIVSEENGNFQVEDIQGSIAKKLSQSSRV